MVLLCASLTGCYTSYLPPSADEFALERTLTNPEMPLPEGAVSSLRLATAELCSAAIPCAEAWVSDLGTFIRFDSIDVATGFASGVDDAEQDRYVVIDLSGLELSEDDRRDVVGTVFAQLPQDGGPFSLFGM
ncbi:hypothetical protein ABIB37_001824 [Agrococcus sp. UYP10]|uniref:hypothetical protein n=1 Tax=Agrococcus sp. UYP10 TaxID=1756355 RepID=UPI003393002D